MAFLDEAGLAELWSLITAEDDKLAAADVKIATGSYAGTGKAGSSNPNTVTLSFVPKVFMVSNGTFRPNGYNNAIYIGFTGGLLWFHGMTKSYAIDGTNVGDVTFSQNGDSISWSVGNGSVNQYAGCQCNTSGVTYKWIAIG